MRYLGFEAYENSINSVNSNLGEKSVVFMAKDGNETAIIISSECGHAGGKIGAELGFKGADIGDGKFESLALSLSLYRACPRPFKAA
jgi:hypothetical protein